MLVLVFVLMLIYRWQVPNWQQRLAQPIPWKYAIIAMGYVTFWAALRSGFADTRAYIISFESTTGGFDEAIKALHENGKAPLWNSIQILFKTFISKDFHYWLAMIAIASGIPIMLTLRNKSADYLFSIYLFIASTTFSWMSNGIRQFLVASVLFGLYFLITERKRLLFVCIVLLCSLIHTTVLLMLPAVFFIDFKPFGKMMMLFVVCVLTSTFFVGPMLNSMESILSNTSYAGNLDQFAEDDGAHPLRVAFESVPVLLAYFKRKQIAALGNNFINLCVNMSTVAAGLFFIAMLTSGIMIGRLPIYFGLYNFILIPFLINYVYPQHRKLLYTGFYVGYIAIYIISTQHYYYISDILGNYF